MTAESGEKVARERLLQFGRGSGAAGDPGPPEALHHLAQRFNSAAAVVPRVTPDRPAKKISTEKWLQFGRGSGAAGDTTEAVVASGAVLCFNSAAAVVPRVTPGELGHHFLH